MVVNVFSPSTGEAEALGLSLRPSTDYIVQDQAELSLGPVMAGPLTSCCLCTWHRHAHCTYKHTTYIHTKHPPPTHTNLYFGTFWTSNPQLI